MVAPVRPAKIEADSNPLRDPRDLRLPRIAGPCGLVIFGVTGDLARKKLMPAVYDLANRGLLPPGFALTGFARRDWEDQDFAQVVHDAVKQYARTPWRESVWNQLAEGIRFVQGTFDDDEAFERLSQTVAELDKVLERHLRVMAPAAPTAADDAEATNNIRTTPDEGITAP